MTALPPLGADVDLVEQPADPSLLDAVCEDCGLGRCTPVATVSWIDAAGESATVVGIACLPGVVDQARGRDTTTRPVQVDYPTWTTEQMVRDGGLSLRRVDHWTRLGLITPIDGARRGTGHPHAFLACEVAHARWLARLTACGLDLRKAHELLCGSHGDRSMALALWRRLGQREAVAAA